MPATIDDYAHASIVLNDSESKNLLIFGRLGGDMIRKSGQAPLTIKISKKKWRAEAVLDKYSARIMAYEIDIPYLECIKLMDQKEISFKFKEKNIIDFDSNIAGRKNLRSVNFYI